MGIMRKRTIYNPKVPKPNFLDFTQSCYDVQKKNFITWRAGAKIPTKQLVVVEYFCNFVLFIGPIHTGTLGAMRGWDAVNDPLAAQLLMVILLKAEIN